MMMMMMTMIARFPPVLMIFSRYTWPNGRWEEATYVMGVKQGRGVEVNGHQ